MADINGSRRSIDLAAEMLSCLLIECPSVRVIAFGSTVTELTGLEPGPGLRLPEPGGSTQLHRAFDYIAAGKHPTRIVLLSDGMPDDPEAALTAARSCAPVRIDALYTGRDGDWRALGFMRQLAMAGGPMGVSGRRNLANPLALAGELQLAPGGPGAVMAPALPPDQRARLTKLAGLLASAHAGERAAAALKASEFLTALGLTWAEALAPVPAAPVVQVVQTPAVLRTWRVVVEELLTSHFGALYETEQRFLPRLLSNGRAPSPKQGAWVLKICARCGVPPWDDAADGAAS